MASSASERYFAMDSEMAGARIITNERKVKGAAQTRRTKRPTASRRTSTQQEESAATLIQTQFRAFRDRNKAVGELFWEAWNELDTKEERELQDTYDSYMQLKKRFGAGRDEPPDSSPRVRANRTYSSMSWSDDEASGSEEPAPRLPADGCVTLKYFMALTEFLKRSGRIPQEDLAKMIVKATEFYSEQPNIVHVSINTRFTVVGDIHGQLSDLLYIFHLNGLPTARNQYLFNGDFVDRGQSSVECISLLLALKLLYPRSVHLNRGNHEARDINSRDGFEREIIEKYQSPLLFDLFSTLFAALPLATVINNKVFVVHGGLFQSDASLSQLNAVDRKHERVYDVPLLVDALWSDPDKNVKDRIKNRRGAGVRFGKSVVKRFLKQNKLSLIIRSHQCKKPGYEWMFNNRLLTVFSASNYCGRVKNDGAFATIDNNDNVTVTPFYAAEDEETKRLSRQHFKLREFVLRKLTRRIAANRLRLIDWYTKVHDPDTCSVTRKLWAQGLREVLDVDIPFGRMAKYLGLPRLDLLGKGIQDDATSHVDYMSFLSRFAPRNQAMEKLSAASADSPDDTSQADLVSSLQQLLFESRYEMESLFRFFDHDGDQEITQDEFVEGVQALTHVLAGSQSWTREQIAAVAQAVDTDGDGKINYEEFFGQFEVPTPQES